MSEDIAVTIDAVPTEIASALTDRYSEMSQNKLQSIYDSYPPEIINLAKASQERYVEKRAKNENVEKGKATPRMRDIKFDQSKGNQVDVANTQYLDFPLDMKVDVADTLMVAADALARTKSKDIAAAAVHDAFVKRRTSLGIPVDPDQAKPYSELSEEMKSYDLEPVQEVSTFMDGNPDFNPKLY